MRLVDYICKAYPPLSNLRGKLLHLRSFVRMQILAFRTRRRYGKILARIHAYPVDRKIRVLFLLNESSKWKCQSLYEALSWHGGFEPMVVAVRADADWKMSAEEFASKYARLKDFCRSRQLRCVDGYSLADDKPIGLDALRPDVVFYSNPWKVAECQQPQNIASFALTCYIPYYVVCYDAPEMDSQQDFHRLLWRYILPNEFWATYFRKELGRKKIAGSMVGLGHPMLDVFSTAKNDFKKEDYVIYAPHWSIPGTGCEDYSTFLETGEFILEYAMSHKELKWCFKPHPTLRIALRDNANWPKERIDAYYSAWGKAGIACYDGNYPELFMKSRALITDCSSFLMEYSSTNRPLIHLVSSRCRFPPAPPSRNLFESFYVARDKGELVAVLRQVLEENKDPKKDKRESAIRDLNIWHVNSADVIVGYISKSLRIKIDIAD